MRILVHDYSGHPFQAELSRELAHRGHQVTHSWCAAHVSGKGNLSPEADDPVAYEPIAMGERIDKLSFLRRLFQELRYGVALSMLTRRNRPEVVLVGNVPIPMLVVYAVYLSISRTPWVHWQQDLQGVAVRSFAGTRLAPYFRLVGLAIGRGERWASRRADAIVVIADSFLDVHRGWGTAHKTVVIPNWAPLGEIYPVERKNDWAVEHHVDEVATIVYSGTLGLKHDPVLLPRLAAAVRARGRDVHLVVVSEGDAMPVVAQESAALGVPVTLLPFQPYRRLPEVLGSADLLVVLLDKSAGAFSVPSKTLSYLCAGRPVLGLMPAENLAAHLIQEAGGRVHPPEADEVDAAADWAAELLGDAERRDELGLAARALAEREFALSGSADAFERLLVSIRG